MVTSELLVGAWLLEAFEDIDADGQVTDLPLGEDPTGILLYLPDRYMSVMMTRSGTGESEILGYSGRWRIENGHLVHHILVSSRPDWAGTRQRRFVELRGDRLSINAAETGSDRFPRRVVRWRRAPEDD